MERTIIKDATKYVGQGVKVAGWVDSRRDHGGIVFLDLRDYSGVLQLVLAKNLAADIKEEYVVTAQGTIQKRPENMINPDLETGDIELKVEKIKVLAKAEPLPFNVKDLKVSLPTLLDYRPLILRNEKIKAIFKIEEEVIRSFRAIMKEMGFFEFQAPTIVPTITEGGAELFPLKYYKYDAYLAQSPQLYKQILVGVFEKVFSISKAFRAEPSVTTRHLSEYTGLDVEMGFIDSWEELMDDCEKILKGMFDTIKKNCQKELKLLGAEIPEIKSIPRVKMREAQQIIFERTSRDNRQESDLEPEDEKEICSWAKEKEGSEFVFITHYPTKKRPFYTFADPEDPNYTLSFDLLFRGMEVVTGSQRINDYDKLVKNIKDFNLKTKDFDFYLQAFKYGMPPEGGFCFGAERLTKQLLGLENVREASLFPRDMERIDQRLSILKPKKITKHVKKN